MAFTTDQEHAIDHGTGFAAGETGPHDVLVSASAGSGKTTVLVERIVRQVIQGADITRMLIVTFTNAATAEMKLRIQAGLKSALTERRAALDAAQRRHLGAQIATANAAPIMTLDAFSLQVVQHYYYVIGLEPGFRMLTDDTERLMLQQQVWDDLSEAYLVSDQARAFEDLIENFSHGETDAGLADVVFDLIRFALTTPDPTGWLKQLPAPYADEGSFTRFLWPEIRAALQAAETSLRAVIADLEDPDPGLGAARENVQLSLDGIQRALNLDAPDYATAKAAIDAIAFARWPNKKIADELKPVKDAAKTARDAVKNALTDVQKSVLITPADLTVALTQVQPMMAMLRDVALEFWGQLQAEKAARRVQDFGDIAQNALRILQAVDAGTGETVGAAYRAQFDSVMVDEYQDINALQEALLDAISRPAPAGNRFMVGDVKQSIYGFRLADPQLFLAKYRRFAAADSDGFEAGAGERIVLADNFRSRPNVLAFTNLIFSQIMDQRVGQLDYDEDAQLRYGAGYPEDARIGTELLLVDRQAKGDEPQDDDDADDSAEAIDKATAEARLVIDKIRALMADPNVVVAEKNQVDHHRLRYGDITLLTRARSQNITIQSEFTKAGIPIVVADAQNYFKTTELMIMLSLLRLIDNPKQEIPLVAVLRSPMVGLSAAQLTVIRLAQPGAFDEALAAFVATKPEDAPVLHGETAVERQERLALIETARPQVIDFLALLGRLRDFAHEHELVELIWRIYAETGYLDYVGGMPGGNQRQANLRALADRAATYEAGGFKGLFAFIRFIELMQKQDKDLATPVTLAPDVDAVHLMTIHGSKGLEFPIVFLLAADKQMNMQDLKQPVILTPNLVGVQWLDPQTREVYSLPQYLAARQVKKAQLLAEEMRLLYVALTRAKERLIIVGSVKSAEKARSTWAKAAEATHVLLPDSLRANVKSYLDWIGAALARTSALTDSPPRVGLAQFATPVTVTFVTEEPETGGTEGTRTDGKPAETAASTVSSGDPTVTATPDLTKWFGFDYPDQVATQTLSFQSVSELKRAFDDPSNLELIASSHEVNGQRFVNDLATPAFMAEGETVTVTPTAIGTATHLVLQQLPLDQPVDEATIQALITELTDERGLIDPAVAARIPVERLVALFASPFGKELLAAGSTVQREAPFSLLYPAHELVAEMPPDNPQDILIHGIIDGYFETEAGVTLFDYKTDHVTQEAAIVARYRGQLNLYALALERVLNRPVTRRLLVLIETGAVVEVGEVE